MSDPASPSVAARPRGSPVYLVLGGVVLVLVPILIALSPSTLLDGPPFWLSGAAMLVGLWLGYDIAVGLLAMPMKISRLRRVFVLLWAPLWVAGLTMLSVDFLIEQLAFVGAQPTQVTRAAPVERVRTRKSRRIVEVALEPKLSTMSVEVTERLYAALQQEDAAGRHCLLITVQTGRRGIRRALSTTRLGRPFGTERLVRCPNR